MSKKIMFVFIILSLLISPLVYAQNPTPEPTFTDAETEEFRINYEKTNKIRTYRNYLDFINRDTKALAKIKSPSETQIRKLSLLKHIKPIVQNEYQALQDRKGDIAFGMFEVLNSEGNMDNPYLSFPRSLFRKEYQFMPPKYIRRAIPWDAVQVEENGKIVNKQNIFNDLKKLQDNGYIILPNIRANARWAIKNNKTTPSSGVCSGATKDMTEEWSNAHGYSKTYYDFISIIAKEFKGKFTGAVTIENEMNAPQQTWCAGSSPEEYVKILLTAQKAFRDHDPKVLVSDGGLTGNAWFWLMLEDKYQRATRITGTSKREAEYNLIAKLASQQIGKTMTLKNTVNHFSFLKRTKTVNGETVYNAPAYMLGLKYIELAKKSNYSRAVNFHYYGHSEGLAYVIPYMRRELGSKVLVNNEMGTQFPASSTFTEEDLAGEMLKKFAIMRGNNVLHPNWYTSPRFTIAEGGGVGVYHNGSFLSPKDYVSPRLQIIKGANIIQKYLDRPTLSRDRSQKNKHFRYTFTGENEIVNVIWGTALYPFSGSCFVYSTLGEILYSPSGENGDTQNLQLSSTMPYYEICANQSSASPLFKPFSNLLPGLALLGLK